MQLVTSTISSSNQTFRKLFVFLHHHYHRQNTPAYSNYYFTIQSETMMMLVNCSNCRTPLQLPPGASSIRCAICQAADPLNAPPPSSSASTHAPPPPSTAPAPYNHAPPPPSGHGRKKAVIIGISYRYSRHELKACINDAKCMRHLLINKFHFPPDSILMLNGTTVDCLRAV